jgi:hypothetical protein
VAGAVALADVAVKIQCLMPVNVSLHEVAAADPSGRWLVLSRRAGVAFITLLWAEWATPAAAYRPFDGTDAAVADVKEVEIELQPAGRLQQGADKSLIGPAIVYNYGFAERWELVVQGQGETPLSESGVSSLTEAGVFLKHVLRPGVLQGQSGLSIATEFGALLPGINAERGVGASWAAIVSQRWDWGTVHLNVMTSLTRDQRGDFFFDAIIEGPSTWKVRPVFEVFSDTTWQQTQTYSGLVGAIWQVRDNLAFDVAMRYALVNDKPVSEFRLGLTFGFPIGGGQRSAEADPGVVFGNAAERARLAR